MSDTGPLSQTGPSGAGLTVRVRFQRVDERAARELAAGLIERAHELANLPECECDVDCDVEWTPAQHQGQDPPAASAAPDPDSGV